MEVAVENVFFGNFYSQQRVSLPLQNRQNSRLVWPSGAHEILFYARLGVEALDFRRFRA